MEYEVGISQGQGEVSIALFLIEEDAENFLDKCLPKGDGSYYIRKTSNASLEELEKIVLDARSIGS